MMFARSFNAMASTSEASSVTRTITITTSTNLGALTTPVVFPSECTNLYNFHTTILGAPSWSTVYTGGCAMSACCPLSKIYTEDNGWYSSYYSPAGCPQGYQTCKGPVEVKTVLPSIEHVHFCCPPGYTCPLWDNYSICVTLRTGATTALVVDNLSRQRIYSTETIPAPSGSLIPYDYAYPLQIRWKDSDFLSISNTMHDTTPTPNGQTPQTTGSVSLSSKKLSPGAIAGIAIAVGLLAIICVVAILWWRSWRRRSIQPRETRLSQKPELDGQAVNPKELYANQVKYELRDTSRKVELE